MGKKSPIQAETAPDRRQQPSSSKDNSLRPLVAIGASAGGLEAILTLLENLPANTGAAYVIVQHLSPTHDSILPDLLERKTKMKVHTVEHGMHIEADHLYVIPPNKYLSIIDHKLLLSPRSKMEAGIHSIDHFLLALAPVYQSRAIAVILSGTATDGTVGVRAIKAEGGITFAQDNTARFQGMPRNATESGYIDFVLPPEKIATELQAIIQGMHKSDLRIENLENNGPELRKIHLMLLNKHDVDFTLYKQTTIIRRIIRRMALNRLSSLEQYTQLLRESGNEADLLYKDLLINVTSFFREPTMYTALAKKIFPALLKGRKDNDPIRIWVPACATGEEPCSIAICLFEYLKDKAITTPIQIFATDLSESSIQRARAGIYSKATLAGISPQRLRKFFVKNEGGYQIIKPIRDVCIFATHNLLKDPPFSRMDIISCQNVLIYLEAGAQKKIMQAFHYALKPNRYLLLGKSETIGSATELFDPVDKDLRIYAKRATPANMQFDFSIRSTHYDSYGEREEMQLPAAAVKETDIEKEAEKIIFAQYMPASVLVNNDLQILRFYGATFPFLQPASGKASLHLLKMIRDELLFELRGLIKQVRKEGKLSRKDHLQLVNNGQVNEITLEVLPVMSSAANPHLLIVFRPTLISTQAEKPKRSSNSRQDEKDRRIQGLEQELKEAREHARSMTEDFEATREELQSANEEVLSSNEELQSINEELETSKEELQSTNEELITINEELQLRNTDLKESVDYTKAIVETIRESLIVLNPDLRVHSANQAFYTNFKLGQDEVEGQYLFEMGNGLFDISDLRNQLRKANLPGSSFQDFRIQHEFTGLGPRILQCHAMRMAGEPGRKARVLLALEDITERTRAEKALHGSEERFRHVSESGFINIMFSHPDGRILDANKAFLDLVGYTQKDLKTGLLRKDRLIPVTQTDGRPTIIPPVDESGKIGPYEKEFLKKDGTHFWALIVGARLENELFVEFIIDITGRKKAEFDLLRSKEQLRENEDRLKMALEAAQMGIWDINLLNGTMATSQRHDQLLGYDEPETGWTISKGQQNLIEEDRQRYTQAFSKLVERGGIKFEGRVLDKHEGIRWINISGQVFYDEQRTPIRAAGVIFDITDRKSNGKEKD